MTSNNEQINKQHSRGQLFTNKNYFNTNDTIDNDNTRDI